MPKRCHDQCLVLYLHLPSRPGDAALLPLLIEAQRVHHERCDPVSLYWASTCIFKQWDPRGCGLSASLPRVGGDACCGFCRAFRRGRRISKLTNSRKYHGVMVIPWPRGCLRGEGLAMDRSEWIDVANDLESLTCSHTLSYSLLETSKR